MSAAAVTATTAGPKGAELIRRALASMPAAPLCLRDADAHFTRRIQVPWKDVRLHPLVAVSCTGTVCIPSIPSTVTFLGPRQRKDLSLFLRHHRAQLHECPYCLPKRVEELLRGVNQVPKKWMRSVESWSGKFKPNERMPFDKRDEQLYARILAPIFAYCVHMPIHVESLQQLAWFSRPFAHGEPPLKDVLTSIFLAGPPDSCGLSITPSDVLPRDTSVTLLPTASPSVQQVGADQNADPSPLSEVLQVDFLTPSLVMSVTRHSFLRFVRPAIAELAGPAGLPVSVEALARRCGWAYEFGDVNGKVLMWRYLSHFPSLCRRH